MEGRPSTQHVPVTESNTGMFYGLGGYSDIGCRDGGDGGL